MLQHFLTTVLSKLAVRKTIEDYEKNQRENIGTLKPPKFVLVVGIASMVIWAMLMSLVLIFSKDVTTVLVCAVVFGSMFALGLFLVLYERNFMATYRDGIIIYRNIFRITQKYACQDIEHAYYKDRGGIQFVFKDGRKLSFDKEESYFYKEIIKREHLSCRFKGEENPIIKVYFHPFLMCPCWTFGGGMLIFSFGEPGLFLFAILVLLFCLVCQLSKTTYDKERKILTRIRCGFSKQFDMNYCLAKPVYEDGFIMTIEIYEKKKKVGKIPVSVEYKNRARLIRALCRIEV